ncbi:MAG: redoxin domain-containing protein [Pyrinomonadaceae bacterium]|nr:redoxin domain-containing protein [Pyrinomonadaceae bacterium]
MKFVYKTAFLCCACAYFVACESASQQQVSQNRAAQTNQTTQTAPNQMPETSKPMPPILSAHQTSQLEKDLTWQIRNTTKSQKLADLTGKVVVLDFWATYCPPCEEEIPHLVELQNKHRADGLQIIGLHSGGNEDRIFIQKFIDKYSINYDIAYPKKELLDFYTQGDDSIPQTFVFDRQGQLVQKFVGFDSQIKTELETTIQNALRN